MNIPHIKNPTRCIKKMVKNGVTGNMEPSTLHVFLPRHNLCQCKTERWEDKK